MTGKYLTWMCTLTAFFGCVLAAGGCTRGDRLGESFFVRGVRREGRSKKMNAGLLRPSKLGRNVCSILTLVVAFAAPAALSAAPPKLERAEPEAVGMHAGKLKEIDFVVAEGLAEGKMPGCVVLVARQGKIVLLKAYGNRRLEPQPRPMTTDTVFDLASLTKPIATATSVMLLVEQGRVQLDEPAATYLPEFAKEGKESITVRHLLTHQAGLIADNPLNDYADGPPVAIERLLAIKPQAPPASRFVYSDVGFMVLGELVRRVSGQDVDAFSKQQVFEPLGMRETEFQPPPALCERAAPTQQRDGHWMQGEVHDPRAYALGGIAGHAGLFSTAEDLAVYAQMLLGGGEYAGVRVLKPETVSLMCSPQSVPGDGLRALGWDMRTGFSSNRGKSFSDRAVGHGGFTGTVFWIDPELQLAVIFLSNRVHPNGKGLVNPLAGRIGTIAADAIEDRPQGKN